LSIPLLPTHPVSFPDPESALVEPDGLLAAGGALNVPWLTEAYGRGIFPWFNSDDDFILWWSPARRATLAPGKMKVSRSLNKKIRQADFEVRVDCNFDAVVAACAEPRKGQDSTWITGAMRSAYNQMHDAGLAHSVEIYIRGSLCGGLYGVSLGRAFFGESMFSRVSDASKIALHALQTQLKRWDFTLIDCQIQNPHLASLGVTEINRSSFLGILQQNSTIETRRGRWQFD